MMKRNIALKWAEALESGQYSQGFDCLNHEDSYCPLGVLCEIAISTGLTVQKTEYRGMTAYDDTVLYLPLKVQRWARVSYNPILGEHPVSYLNDYSGLSFPEIAQLIRQHLVHRG